jgi:hypothetical protein
MTQANARQIGHRSSGERSDKQQCCGVFHGCDGERKAGASEEPNVALRF